MYKLRIPLLFFCLSLPLVLTNCSKEDSGLGGCSVGCGVVGLTGYSFTEYKFISRAECEKKKEETSSCRVVYCPPTGNEEDCIEF